MGGGSQSTQDTTTNQINQIPAWMSDAGQQNYAYAQQVAQQPLQQYQGQMVADVAPQTQQAWNVAANSGNVGADQYNAATAGYLNAMNTSPMMNTAAQSALANPVTAAQSGLSQTGSSNLGQYMNPYTSSVINATLPIMQQQLGLQQNQQQNAASSANAFGGSRQGVQQGVTQAQGAMNMAQMAAQLNNANYNQARQASEFDVGQANNMGQFNANQANTVGLQNMNAANNMGQFNAGALNTTAAQNQAAQQAAANSGIQAAYGLTNTGQSMNAANAANYNLLQSAGAGQSMQAQNQINAQMAKFNQAFNYPQQQLGVLEGSLGMTPHDTSTSGQSNTTTTTPTDWAGLIKGGADAAGSLLPLLPASDKEMKTDITKLGKDPKTGLQMHAYRYKGDPKSYPKVVGPMAQEVQEKYPDKAKRVGGKLTVSPDVMSAAGVQGYAAGTPFVGQPPLTPFLPPSSPGVAKGIAAMSAFRPPVRLPRGAGVPKMQKFAFGSSDVQAPDMSGLDDSDFTGGNQPGVLGLLGKAAQGVSKVAGDVAGGKKPAAGGDDKSALQPGQPSMGYLISGFADGTDDVQPGPTVTYPTGQSQQLMVGPPRYTPLTAAERQASPDHMGPMYSRTAGRAVLNDPRAAPLADPRTFPAWKQFAGGIAAVPGQGMEDTVPSMLTPGEAVLTPRAAQHVGRDKIAVLNAMLPPVSSRSTASPRAGARGIAGALANTKRRPKVMGGLSG